MSRGRRFGVATALAILLGASGAAAAPSARLVYVRDVGADDCPDESALRSAVAARLGYEPFFPHAPATLFAEVSRKDGVYRASIKLVDETNAVRGARVLEHRGRSCADILDAMALSMSIAIDPESLVRAPAVAKEEEPQPEPAPEPPPAPREEVAEIAAPGPPAEEPAPAPAAGPRIVATFGAAFAGWVGAAPSASAGALIFGGVRFDRASLLLEGRGDLPSSSDVALGAVSTSFLGGSVTPCYGYGWLLGCGVVTVGRIRAEGEGIARSRADSSLHAFAGLRGGVLVPLTSRVDLRVVADVLYLLTPLTLRIDFIDVYEMPALSAGLSAGAAVRFP